MQHGSSAFLISVNPDTVVASRKSVAVLKQKIQMEKALGLVTKAKIASIPLDAGLMFGVNVEK